MKYKIYCFLALCIALFSCTLDDDSPVDYREANQQVIEEYLAENGLTAQKTSSGLYYIVEQTGNGTFPTANSTVKVNYKGYTIPEGVEFDQGTEVSFALEGLIYGWIEGLPKFSEGGSGKLFVPAHLAYGPNYPSNNGVIAFNIELLEVL